MPTDLEFLLDGDKNKTLVDEILKQYMEDRVIVFNQGVDDGLLEDVILHIWKWNMEDKDLPVDKRKPIRIIINSCGGDVYSATALIDVIKTSKTPVYGVATGLVASAAFYIFVGCHKRYAFQNTVLLMHDGELQLQSTSVKAKQTMQFFGEMDKRIKDYIIERTKITEDFYDEHFSDEYYMYANAVGRDLGCVDYIIGEDADIDDIF